jgi:transcriptional regulator
MYIPNAFREDDAATMVAFMRANSFVTLVSVIDGAPFASHVPVVVSSAGDAVTLTGHLAKANPHWRAFGAGETLAIFTGPHAYVSPSLYEKRESVPTWNYIAVHAYGTPRAMRYADDPAALERALQHLIAANESSYQAHWDSLPESFRTGMMGGVVGFEMPVSRLEGKYKLSQNRSHADRHSVAHALLGSADQATHATGEHMRRGLEPEKET